MQRQRRGKVSGANRLSSEPPRAGSPARLLRDSSQLQPPLAAWGLAPDGRAPKGPACSWAAGPGWPAARRGPAWWAAAGSGAVRPRLVAWLHSATLLMCIQVE